MNAELTAVPTLHNRSIDTKSLALLATTGSTTGGSGASAGGNKNDSSPNKDGTSKSYLQTREEKIEKSRYVRVMMVIVMMMMMMMMMMMTTILTHYYHYREVRSDERNRRRYGRKHDSDLKYRQTSLFDA